MEDDKDCKLCKNCLNHVILNSILTIIYCLNQLYKTLENHNNEYYETIISKLKEIELHIKSM